MYTHILIAIDGSDLASRGLDHGLSLAKALGAKVLVLTVTEPLSKVGLQELSAQTGGMDVISDLTRNVETQANDTVNHAKREAERLGVACETLVIKDRHAAEGILDAVKAHGINLIVMASHGRRGVSRLLLGSQTLDVITHGNIPVLVVK